MSDKKTVSLHLTRINIQTGRFYGEPTDSKLVGQAMERIRSGSELLPVNVLFDGERYWLAGLPHLVIAADKLERETLECDVKEGTWQDAKKASGHHDLQQLPLNNDDFQTRATLFLTNAELLDSLISEQTGAMLCTIREARKELIDNLNDNFGVGAGELALKIAGIVPLYDLKATVELAEQAIELAESISPEHLPCEHPPIAAVQFLRDVVDALESMEPLASPSGI